jgi:hypothetical protein
MQLRLPIFEPSPLNIQLLKGEVIPATRLRHASRTGTFRTWSPNPSRSVMKNQNYVPWELFATPCCVYSKINVFIFFHIHGLRIFVSTLSDFH